MATDPKRHIVPGSERAAVAGARVVGPANPQERIDVTLRLRPRTSLQSMAQNAVQADVLPAQRTYLSREQYAGSHGADPADIAKVRTFAQAHGLAVVEANEARRSVVVTGDVESLSKAFGVTLEQVEHDGGTYRGRTGAITVPAELEGIVQGVFGLDDRPQAEPHFQVQQPVGVFRGRAATASFTPVELAKLYNFPAGLDGSGQCIGIIELGGGYRPADIKAYFAGLACPRRPSRPSSSTERTTIRRPPAAPTAK